MNATRCTCFSYICHGRHTINLSTIFGTKCRHRRWLLATTYVLTFFTITLRVLSVTDRSSPYRDLAEIRDTETAQSSCSHRVIFTTSHKNRMMPLRCLCGRLLLISRVYTQFWAPNDYLKSHIVLTIIVLCLYGDCVIYLRCVYGQRACDFFQNLS